MGETGLDMANRSGQERVGIERACHGWTGNRMKQVRTGKEGKGRSDQFKIEEQDRPIRDRKGKKKRGQDRSRRPYIWVKQDRTWQRDQDRRG